MVLTQGHKAGRCRRAGSAGLPGRSSPGRRPECRRRRGSAALPAAPGARPLFSAGLSGDPAAVAAGSAARGSALHRRTPRPLGLAGSSHSSDCIINVNGGVSLSGAGSPGLLLHDTYTAVVTRESGVSTGVENQPVRDPFQTPRNAERLQDCFIKVIENKNYSEQRIRASAELPHIYYLSLQIL